MLRAAGDIFEGVDPASDDPIPPHIIPRIIESLLDLSSPRLTPDIAEGFVVPGMIETLVAHITLPATAPSQPCWPVSPLKSSTSATATTSPQPRPSRTWTAPARHRRCTADGTGSVSRRSRRGCGFCSGGGGGGGSGPGGEVSGEDDEVVGNGAATAGSQRRRWRLERAFGLLHGAAPALVRFRGVYLDRIVRALMRAFEPDAAGCVSATCHILKRTLETHPASVDILLETCPATREPYLFRIWRCCKEDQARSLFEAALFIFLPLSPTQRERRFSALATLGLLRAVTVANFGSDVLTAAEHFVRLVDMACCLDHGEALFPADVADELFEDVGRLLRRPLLADVQYAACVAAVHAAAVRSVGTSALAPPTAAAAGAAAVTAVPGSPVARRRLESLRASALAFVTRMAATLVGPDSPQFGVSQRALKATGSSSVRLQILETLLEALFEAAAETQRDDDDHSRGRESLQHLFSVVPWAALVSWYFERYRTATIMQSAIYKLFHLALEYFNEAALKWSFPLDELVDRIDAASARDDRNPYASLLAILIGSIAEQNDAGALAARLRQNEVWEALHEKCMRNAGHLYSVSEDGRVQVWGPSGSGAAAAAAAVAKMAPKLQEMAAADAAVRIKADEVEMRAV
ncbi:hypothetical protein DFJ73DRAFT_958901 [Zopfochytrium polystomum]|nr:hypothetical protein DFJ73DRAFT_958901 [Zopfochytrium polystomum]